MSNEQFKVLTGIDLDLEFKDQPEIEYEINDESELDFES